MLNIEHPDTLQDYRRLKQIEKGGKQAIETTAMNAMYDALDEGRSREEAERIFFNHFNKSHGKQKQASIPYNNLGSIRIGADYTKD